MAPAHHDEQGGGHEQAFNDAQSVNSENDGNSIVTLIKSFTSLLLGWLVGPLSEISLTDD